MPDDAVPPRGALLLVSPHMDDAALSCAALIGRGESVDVLTVCAGAPDPPLQGDWDRLCGFVSSSESVSARREEEARAFAGSGHHLTTLDVLEGQHFDGPRAPGEAQPIVDAIVEWRERSGRGTIALPAGAGRSSASLEAAFGRPLGARRARVKRLAGRPGRWILARVYRAVMLSGDPVIHEDHRFVRDAALAALRDLDGVRLLLYEEIPYLWGEPADREVARVAAAHGISASDPIVVPVDREEKAQRLTAYPSQLPHLFMRSGPLDTPGGLPPVERYWWLGSDQSGGG